MSLLLNKDYFFDIVYFYIIWVFKKNNYMQFKVDYILETN